MGINGARSSVRPVQGDGGTAWHRRPSRTLGAEPLCLRALCPILWSYAHFHFQYIWAPPFASVGLTQFFVREAKNLDPQWTPAPHPISKLHELPLPPAWVDPQHSLREGRNSSALSTLPNICLFVVCSLETGFISSRLCSRHSNN